MGTLMPQGPNTHCAVVGAHEAHPNPQSEAPTAWCDGVVELEPFVELAIRVPLSQLGIAGATQAEAVRYLAENPAGLVILVDQMDHVGTALRVRTREADRVYPVKRGVPEGQGSLW